MTENILRTSDTSRFKTDSFDGGLFGNPFRRALRFVPDIADINPLATNLGSISSSSSLSSSAAVAAAAAASEASRSLTDVGDVESRRQDDFLGDLDDLKAKVMDTLKEKATKEKFRREFDDAVAARRADDDAAAHAAADFPISVFRRRPTFFIH